MPHLLSVRRIRPVGAGAAAIAALALAGCAPGILTQSYQQNDEIGTAQVNDTLCANLQTIAATDTAPASSSCQFGNNQAFLPTQYLLGYQVRNDVTAPQTITSSKEAAVDINVAASPELRDAVREALPGVPADPTQKVNYTQSSSYASELQRLYPAPTGQRWVGYLSDVQQPAVGLVPGELGPQPGATGDRPPDQWDVNPQFALQQPADGPFVGPFTHATIVGYRNLPISGGPSTGTAPGDPVVCHEPSQTPPTIDTITPLVQSGDLAAIDRAVRGALTDSGNSYCDTGDDQAADPTLTRLAAGSDASARYAGFPFVGHPDPTRDLWLGGSSGAVIAQGGSGAVNFTAKFAGAAGPAFGMTATTDLAGAGAAPQPPTFAPGADSTTGVPVTVTVPADAAVGQHTVRLTANGVNGQSRAATATYDVALRVVAPSRSLAAHVTIRHRFLVRLVKGAKERVRLSCPANSTGCAGTLMFKTRFGTSNTLRYSLKAGESKTYVLTPSRALIRYLMKHKKTALATATVYVTNGGDALTQQITDQRTIHISPRPKK